MVQVPIRIHGALLATALAQVALLLRCVIGGERAGAIAWWVIPRIIRVRVGGGRPVSLHRLGVV